MKINFKAKILVLGLVVVSAIIGAKAFSMDAHADEGKTAMFVSPMTQKIILVPGETYSGTIAVANGSDATKDLKFTTKVGSYSPVASQGGKGDYGGVDVTTVSTRNIMMDWVTIDKSGGTVAPNEQVTIGYTIKVPNTAPAGAQYASILVLQEDDDAEAKSGNSGTIKNKVQLASAILANVAGETIEKGKISENNLPTILTSNRLEATSMVRNDGNVYTDATYTLQVWPMFSNEELCTNEEKAETSVILPNTERYHVQTCDLPAVGVFRAKQVVKIFGEESVIEKTIIVCPIWLMILTLIVIIAIIVIITMTVKKNKKAKKSVDTD